MKIRKSFEQAICILLLLSTQNRTFKSKELSDKLSVSESYLKKITRQLVVYKLVTSVASKNGGITLNKSPNDITLLDIFVAIEGEERFVETTHLVEKVFDTPLQIEETEALIIRELNKAEDDYKTKLKQITLGNLISAVHNKIQ